MPYKFLNCFLLFLLASTVCSAAVAADQIIWGKYAVPPYMILEGERANQGIFDLILRILKGNMPQYQHVELEAPFPRIVNEIKNGDHWCYNGALKTPERENYAYFSIPSSIFLPLRVIVRRDRLAQFKGEQSLQALLEKHKFKTTVMRNRSYSPTIDKLLAAYPPKENYSEQIEATGMLLAGRIDYMIELPLLAFDQASAMGHPGELVAIPMQETNEVVFNRVMCPKNEWGRKVIEQVNQVLRSKRDTLTYRKIVEKWYAPESVTEIHKIYDTVFLTAP